MVDGIKYDSVVTEGVAKQIANSIREAILEGRLQANERLPTEHELAERFAVSRPTIREALKHLAAQNLIQSRRGSTGGTFVKPPSQEEAHQALTSTMTMLVSMGSFDFDQVIEARFELEQVCCRLAAERRAPSHLESMQSEIEVQKGEISDEEFCASDVRFHRALVDASGNGVLQYLMFAVIEALQPLANMIVFRFRERTFIVAQHQRIVDALKAREPESALQALQDQLVYIREQYAMALEWKNRKRARTGDESSRLA